MVFLAFHVNLRGTRLGGSPCEETSLDGSQRVAASVWAPLWAAPEVKCARCPNLEAFILLGYSSQPLLVDGLFLLGRFFLLLSDGFRIDFEWALGGFGACLCCGVHLLLAALTGRPYHRKTQTTNTSSVETKQNNSEGRQLTAQLWVGTISNKTHPLHSIPMLLRV